MSIFVVFPKVEAAKRGDGKNTFIVSAANAAGAYDAAEALTGDVADTFNSAHWDAVQLTDSAVQDFIVESRNGPVGKVGSPWAKLDRGGTPL